MASHPHRLVVRCCYIGMFVQAMVINLAPLLFIPLKDQYGLTFEQVGRLVFINFMTQMLVDLACCGLADRVSLKPLTVAANLLAGIGLWVFALTPAVMSRPYDGLVIGTVVFSVGCGLLEVLLSPIVNAVPSARKARDMALLHAWYPIGKVVVILVTGLLLYGLGASSWRWIMLAWSVVPFLNTVGFLMVELPPLVSGGQRHTLRRLMRAPAYLLLVLAIGLAGATEVTVAQWTSAFVQRGLGFAKVVADLVGFSLFGVGMIVGRLWFGFKGESDALPRNMAWGAALSAVMCLVMALSPWPVLSLAACGLAGLFVSLLWPGTVSLAAARFPLAGASMFAMLAAAGDTGAGFMPWGVGAIADWAPAHVAWLGAVLGRGLPPDQLGLRAGLLATAVCPVMMALLVAVYARLRADRRNENAG